MVGNTYLRQVGFNEHNLFFAGMCYSEKVNLQNLFRNACICSNATIIYIQYGLVGNIGCSRFMAVEID